MDDIKFPRCGGRGLRIEWGMLPFELHERYESDPDVVIGGCVVEVDSDNDCVVTHECASCKHRWESEGWVDSDDRGDGEQREAGAVEGIQVLAGEKRTESDRTKER